MRCSTSAAWRSIGVICVDERQGWFDDRRRALSAGKLPTIPLVHWAVTSLGVETMNIGDPMTGIRKRWSTGGKLTGRDTPDTI